MASEHANENIVLEDYLHIEVQDLHKGLVSKTVTVMLHDHLQGQFQEQQQSVSMLDGEG